MSTSRQLLLSTIHIMKNKQILTLIFCISMLVVALAVPRIFAKPDEQTILRARKEQLLREIAENADDYKLLEPQKARNQQRCTLAAEQERQLTLLNTQNNTKRNELKFIESLLDESIVDPLLPLGNGQKLPQ